MTFSEVTEHGGVGHEGALPPFFFFSGLTLTPHLLRCRESGALCR